MSDWDRKDQEGNEQEIIFASADRNTITIGWRESGKIRARLFIDSEIRTWTKSIYGLSHTPQFLA